MVWGLKASTVNLGDLGKKCLTNRMGRVQLKTALLDFVAGYGRNGDENLISTLFSA